MVVLRSNMAACSLAMKKYVKAVGEAQDAVALDPLHVESYSILCKAHHALKLIFDTAEAMAVVVALTLPRRLDDDMLSIFNSLVDLKMLPLDTRLFACVTSDLELQGVLKAQKRAIVLKPGNYTGCLGHLELDYPLILIGLGKVNIMSGASRHSLLLIRGQMQARRLNFVGDVRITSTVCVDSERAMLSLTDCTIEGHKGQGVLVIDGCAVILRCTFRNLGKQAVEVRRGSVALSQCYINRCCQGVVASGKIKLLRIKDCKIDDIAHEGVLISFKNRSEATHGKFGLEELRASLPGGLAARRGPESTMVKVAIENCVVKGCRDYGLWLDGMHANVSILNSMLVDNAPAACYVKGGTTVLLDRCQIEVDKVHKSGLIVGINYTATVIATGNKFVVVDRKSAMVEEVSADGRTAMIKSIVDLNNTILVQPEQPGSTSKNGLPRAGKLDSDLGTEDILGKGAPSGSFNASEVRALSQQALAQTSRRVLHTLRNLPVFSGVRDTLGHDLSLEQELSARSDETNDAPRTIRILLGACTDVRNLLKTLFSLQQRPGHLLVQVVLNDWNLAILARSIVLLSLIVQGTSAADMLAIWANRALTSSQKKDLDSVLGKLASSLPDWLVCSEEPGNNLGAQLLEAFTAWRDCTMTLQELDNLHTQSMTEDYQDMVVDFVRNTIGNVHVNEQLEQVHIATSNVERATKSANILFLEAPNLRYSLHWASSICRAIDRKETDSTSSSSSWSGFESSGSGELLELLMRSIGPHEINAVVDLLKQGALHVGVINCDILKGMLYGGCLRLLHKLNGQSSTDSTTLFDFIDLSNTADYLSVPAVVQAGLPLLTFEKHAVLHVESFTWGLNFDTRAPLEFLKCSIGMDLDKYKELLGVSVQAQVVGSSRLPVLQTQWTWDIPANQEATLTGAMVLLEMMTAAKLYCALDRAKNISNVWVPDKMMAGFMGGIENSSPLTMLHLLRLRFPVIALQVVHVLVAANDACSIRIFELVSHAVFQEDPLLAPPLFFSVVFQANVQYTTLLACAEAPLCLMVSEAPVRVAQAPVKVVTTNDVFFLEAFSYSFESDRVEIMLPMEPLEDPMLNSRFMTLCAVTNDTELQALGSSIPCSKFTAKPLQAPFSSWIPCRGMGATRALLSNDLELLELLKSIHSSDNDDISAQSWKTHAVLETSRFVIVELLLPRPLPGPDKVAISVTSSGSSLKVGAKAATRSKRKTLDFFPDQEHTIELPAAVVFGERHTKLSRKLGVMIVHLPKAREVSA